MLSVHLALGEPPLSALNCRCGAASCAVAGCGEVERPVLPPCPVVSVVSPRL